MLLHQPSHEKYPWLALHLAHANVLKFRSVATRRTRKATVDMVGLRAYISMTEILSLQVLRRVHLHHLRCTEVVRYTEASIIVNDQNNPDSGNKQYNYYICIGGITYSHLK